MSLPILLYSNLSHPNFNDLIYTFCNLKVVICIHFEENLKSRNFTRRNVDTQTGSIKLLILLTAFIVKW